MSHLIGYKVYKSDRTPNHILADLNSFAYDPMETSSYHGHLSFHKNKVYANREEAEDKIDSLIKGSYDDHAVLFKENGKEWWLVKYEYHC